MEAFVVEVLVEVVVDEAEGGVAIVVDEVRAVEAVVDVEAHEEDPTPFLNPTGTLVCLSPRARTTCWSPKISFLESLYTARSGYRSRAALKGQRQNTVCGILSAVNWRLVFLVDSTTFSFDLEQKCCTSELLAERVSVM